MRSATIVVAAPHAADSWVQQVLEDDSRSAHVRNDFGFDPCGVIDQYGELTDPKFAEVRAAPTAAELSCLQAEKRALETSCDGMLMLAQDLSGGYYDCLARWGSERNCSVEPHLVGRRAGFLLPDACRRPLHEDLDEGLYRWVRLTARALGHGSLNPRSPKLKGSIGEGPNHSNFSDQSAVNIVSEFRKCCYK